MNVGICIIAIALLGVGCAAGRHRNPDDPQRTTDCVRAPSRRYTGVGVGGAFACARRESGAVDCWGSRDGVPLATAGQGFYSVDESLRMELVGLRDAESLSVGPRGACAVRAGGRRVLCWGTLDSQSYQSFQPIASEARVEHVALGASHACALTEQGAVFCWGETDHHQIADPGEFPARPAHVVAPRVIPGLPPMRAIAAGVRQTCGIARDGRVLCWGEVTEPGMATQERAHPRLEQPYPIDGLSDVVSIGVGESHGCAVSRDGAVRCWGSNWQGQRGMEPRELSEAVNTVPGIDDAAEVACGPRSTCVRTRAGRVSCFGWNEYGALGNTRAERQPTPGEVEGVTDAVQISVGYTHGCALRRDGSVRCWGVSYFHPRAALLVTDG